MNELERFDRNAKFEKVLWITLAGVFFFLGIIFLFMLFSPMPNNIWALWPIIIFFGLGISFIAHEVKWGKTLRQDRRAAIIAGIEMEAKQMTLKEANK